MDKQTINNMKDNGTKIFSFLSKEKNWSSVNIDLVLNGDSLKRGYELTRGPALKC
jgi:hypothetical protein